MDFNPDENRFRDKDAEDDDEDGEDSDGPQEFRPRPAVSYKDIMSLPPWQDDGSIVKELSLSGRPAPAPTEAQTAPLHSPQLDPLQAADASDTDAVSDDESEEEGAKTAAEAKAAAPPVVKFPVDLEINSRISLWCVSSSVVSFSVR